MKNFYSLIISLLFISTPAYASAYLPASVKQALKQSTDVNYLSVLVSLGVVILLIYLTGIIYAKLNILGQKTAKMQYKGLEDPRIVIHSTTPIGPNKNLMVIEVSGKKLLIGSTNESINLIKDLDETVSEEKEIQNTNELSSSLPLDKIYPKIEEDEKEINIEDNSDIGKPVNEDPKYNTEEFGLYKKYL